MLSVYSCQFGNIHGREVGWVCWNSKLFCVVWTTILGLFLSYRWQSWFTVPFILFDHSSRNTWPTFKAFCHVHNVIKMLVKCYSRFVISNWYVTICKDGFLICLLYIMASKNIFSYDFTPRVYIYSFYKENNSTPLQNIHPNRLLQWLMWNIPLRQPITYL